MKYVIVNNFDDGKTQGKKGEEYKGPNAEALLKAGLIQEAEKKAQDEPPQDPPQDPETDEGTAGEGDEDSEGSETDIEKMTVAQLKEYITAKGGTFDATAKKADLVTVAKALI